MNCFKKTQRLLKKSAFDNVFNKSKKIVTSEFIILYRENSLGYARLGLALSKKNIPKAHARNRIKRLLREIFRTTNLKHIDIIFLAKKGVVNLENKIILNKLGREWSKLKSVYAM